MKQKRSLLFLAAILCLGYGIMQNEPTSVMRKAITFCLECIGIG